MATQNENQPLRFSGKVKKAKMEKLLAELGAENAQARLRLGVIHHPKQRVYDALGIGVRHGGSYRDTITGEIVTVVGAGVKTLPAKSGT